MMPRSLWSCVVLASLGCSGATARAIQGRTLAAVSDLDRPVATPAAAALEEAKISAKEWEAIVGSQLRPVCDANASPPGDSDAVLAVSERIAKRSLRKELLPLRSGGVQVREVSMRCASIPAPRGAQPVDEAAEPGDDTATALPSLPPPVQGAGDRAQVELTVDGHVFAVDRLYVSELGAKFLVVGVAASRVIAVSLPPEHTGRVTLLDTSGYSLPGGELVVHAARDRFSGQERAEVFFVEPGAAGSPPRGVYVDGPVSDGAALVGRFLVR